MMSEKSPTVENEALAKKLDATHQELTSLKSTIRTGGRIRLVLLLAIVAFLAISIWSFYSLGKELASKENLDTLAQAAQKRSVPTRELALKHVESLSKTAVPKLQEIFVDQVNADMPKYQAVLNEQTGKLTENLDKALNDKLNAHFQKSSEKYVGILQEEFPELNDPKLLDEFSSGMLDIMDRLVAEYYSDDIRRQVEELGAKWDKFEMAPEPKDGPTLEKRFLVALLKLAAMKLDEEPAAEAAEPEVASK